MVPSREWLELGVGVVSLWKLQLQSLLADEPPERGDPGLVLLDQVGGVSIVVKAACFVFVDPDADQVARDAVTLRKAVQRMSAISTFMLRRLAIASAV